jgi:threonine/homoserine/homoserine lactone efflux protein
MIDIALLVAFIAAASVLTITPGVDTAMVLRSTATEGGRSGVFAGLGIALGCLVWGAAVALGLGALLQVSEVAYTVVKWVGAGYLFWLGAHLLLQPRKALASTEDETRQSGFSAFRKGFLTNLLNPKVGVFYVTFLPQFVPQGSGIAAYTFFLASVHVGLTAAWFAVLIAATVPLGRWLRKPTVITTMDRLTGLIFIGFGLKLVTSKA